MACTQAQLLPRIISGLEELSEVPAIIAEGQLETIVMSIPQVVPLTEHICVQHKSMPRQLLLFGAAVLTKSFA